MEAALRAESARVEIYTDGACSGNPGPGGYGAILTYKGHTKEISGWASITTNNRMELLAAIRALEALKRPCDVEMYVDSQYLKNGITQWIERWQQNQWRTASKKPVKNADLWKRLLDLTREHNVKWHWVKGHSGEPLNERADLLAREAIKKGKEGLMDEDQSGRLPT